MANLGDIPVIDLLSDDEFDLVPPVTVSTLGRSVTVQFDIPASKPRRKCCKVAKTKRKFLTVKEPGEFYDSKRCGATSLSGRPFRPFISPAQINALNDLRKKRRGTFVNKPTFTSPPELTASNDLANKRRGLVGPGLLNPDDFEHRLAKEDRSTDRGIEDAEGARSRIASDLDDHESDQE